MPVHDGSGSNQDALFPCARPARHLLRLWVLCAGRVRLAVLVEVAGLKRVVRCRNLLESIGPYFRPQPVDLKNGETKWL